MSVTITLYKIVDNVEYTGRMYDHVKWSPNNTEALDKLEDSLNHPSDEQDRINSFSDKSNHELLDLGYYLRCYKKHRGYRRFHSRINKHTLKTYKSANGYEYKYLVCDQVAYIQGSNFIRNSFFKKEITTIVMNSKTELQRFIAKYVSTNHIDTETKTRLNSMVEAFEKGMICICSW